MAKRSASSKTPRPEPPVSAASGFGSWPFVTITPKGCWIDVAVIPNARQTEAIGLHDGCLRLRLAAQPVDGAANDALQRWLASSIGLARSRVQLEKGQSSRRKRLKIDVDEATLRGWLLSLPAEASDSAGS